MRCFLCVHAWGCFLWVAILAASVESLSAGERSNLIVIFTDDHGYADLSCQAVLDDIKTPHIDTLAGESSSLENYHVAPTCSPTRAALMTGRPQLFPGSGHLDIKTGKGASR